GYMSFAWFETFSVYPHIYMSNEFLVNRFLDYPYDVNYSMIVSRHVFQLEFNPNSNIMSYGFANFGYIGIVIYALFSFSLMYLVDFSSHRVGSLYLRLGALAPATLFLEADPWVVLVSFGFGLI